MDVSSSLKAEAASLAAKHFTEQVAIDFCGDQVDSIATPRWLKDSTSWLPAASLRHLGLRADVSCSDVLATAAADPHVDAVNGLTVCVVLHNDGLTFQQGRKKLTPSAGDYFLFDDRKPHAVHPSKSSTTFLCITAPVRPLK